MQRAATHPLHRAHYVSRRRVTEPWSGCDRMRVNGSVLLDRPARGDARSAARPSDACRRVRFVLIPGGANA